MRRGWRRGGAVVVMASSARLEQRFDELVRKLRPYALRERNPANKRLLQLWLGRLNQQEEQPGLRNDYLLELYRQMRKNCLRPPFAEPPQPGKLMPLSRFQRLPEMTSSGNELTETSPGTSARQPRCSWPKPSAGRSKSLPRKDSNCPRRGRSEPPGRRCDSSSPSRSLFRQVFSPTSCEHDNRELLRMYRERVETLSKIATELEAQNEKLKKRLAQQQVDVIEEPSQVEPRVKELLAEISTLKTELAKVNEIKDKLKAKHSEIVERHRAQMTEELESMKGQLEGTKDENRQLHEKIASAERQIQEMTCKQNEAVANRKSNEQHWQEQVENTRSRYEAMLRDKEVEIKRRDEIVRQREIEVKEKSDQLDELSARLQEMQNQLGSKSHEECKLQAILNSQYGMIREELTKMRSNIERVSKKDNDEHKQQVEIFMKNIELLVKRTNKLKTEYDRKIYHIKSEHEKVVKDLQRQLAKAKREGPYVVDKFGEVDVELPVALQKNKHYWEFLDVVKKAADHERHSYLEKLSSLDQHFNCQGHLNTD